MARDSIANTKAELFALMSSGGRPTVAGVAAAYDFEPANGNMLGPASITISTGGMDENFYDLHLRIYRSADTDPREAQADIDALIMLVEAKLTSAWPRSRWDVEFSPELVSFVATCVLRVGREDDL
jgi:hypothetical protein